MKDKLFFTNVVDFDVIVDFGCADGTFLQELSKIKPNVKLIGYDLDDTMLSKAQSKLGKKALFTNNWYDAVKYTSSFKNPLLNLSSVIHEVYSYSRPNVISQFWSSQVFGGDFKYIYTVKHDEECNPNKYDMYNKEILMDRESDIGPICDFYLNKNENINNNINDTKINDIESSIHASLLNDKKETNICFEKKYSLYNFCAILLFLVTISLLVGMVYLYIYK
jgi:hypothetical protein